MKRYMIASAFVIVLVALLIIALTDIGINGIVLSQITVADLTEKYQQDDILIVHLTQTTGPSWEIVNYSGNAHNELIVLDFPFDPKWLKQNRDWDFMGLQVNFIIIAKREQRTIRYPGLDEEYKLIKAKRIFIDTASYKGEIGTLKIKDMRTNGILKAFIGCFIPSYRYSY